VVYIAGRRRLWLISLFGISGWERSFLPPCRGLPEYHRRARVSCPVILRPGVPTFRAGTVRNDNGHSALRGAWRLARTYSLALVAYLDYCPRPRRDLA